MSYIRPGHAMRHVDGISKDYVYDDGCDIVDHGSLTDAGLIEILGRYFYMRKYGRDDRFEKYVLMRLAARMKVKLRPRPLSKEEWIAEDGKIWREEQKKVHEEFPELFGSAKVRGSSGFRLSKKSKGRAGMSSASINVARHFVNSTRSTGPDWYRRRA